jgi:hypothetical protein
VLLPGNVQSFAVTTSSILLNIETICSQRLFDRLIAVYFERLHCLTPIVHRQTFESDINSNRVVNDPQFFSFLFVLCTWVCAMLPAHFTRLRDLDCAFQYTNINEMLERCECTVLSLRQRTYFEQPSNLHCVISLLLCQSFAFTGLEGRSHIYLVETTAMLRSLGAHIPSTYRELNIVECQVRKKIFWINFMMNV